MANSGREKYSRSEKSLSQLTKKFVSMLRSCENDLDLNTVSLSWVDHELMSLIRQWFIAINID